MYVGEKKKKAAVQDSIIRQGDVQLKSLISRFTPTHAGAGAGTIVFLFSTE
jgi:hypothetical protein